LTHHEIRKFLITVIKYHLKNHICRFSEKVNDQLQFLSINRGNNIFRQFPGLGKWRITILIGEHTTKIWVTKDLQWLPAEYSNYNQRCVLSITWAITRWTSNLEIYRIFPILAAYSHITINHQHGNKEQLLVPNTLPYSKHDNASININWLIDWFYGTSAQKGY